MKKTFAPAPENDYLYDANGNMNTDNNKEMQLTYNHLNLPQTITFAGGALDYYYTAAGDKIVKGIGNQYTYYMNGFVYDSHSDNHELQYILTNEGRITKTAEGYQYEYFLKDHLGNTRVSFKAAGNKAELLQEDHYYPFGLELGGLSFAGGQKNKYLYNGKEKQEEFGLDWYSYGARFYDPQLGRFPCVDPIAEDFPHLSPFNYADNSPIANIDLHGLQSVWAGSGTIMANAQGKIDNKTMKQIQTMQGKQAGKAVKYLGLAATIVSSPVGIIIGVPTTGISIGKDIATVAGGDKKKLSKVHDTPLGIFSATAAKAAGRNERLAGALGDLAFGMISFKTLARKPKSIKDVVVNTSIILSTNVTVKEVKEEMKELSSNYDNIDGEEGSINKENSQSSAKKYHPRKLNAASINFNRNSGCINISGNIEQVGFY